MSHLQTSERGSTTIEMVLMVPVLVFLVMCIAALGYRADASLRVHHAAEVAARTASMRSRPVMERVATEAAVDDLSTHHAHCNDLVVRTSHGRFGVMHTVAVTVDCMNNGNGLVPMGLFSGHIRATSTEVIDVFTYR